MISDTISSIQTNLENAYDELEDKGATIPANKNIQNLANAIASISSGGGIEDYTDLDNELDRLENAVGLYRIYTISNNLTNAVSNNSSSNIDEFSSYTAIITALNGYKLEGATVSVIMGDTDITSTVYDNGVINIAKITGDLEITVIAVEIEGWITFSSESSFTLKTVDTIKHWDGTLEYSTNKQNWSAWNGELISSGANNNLYIRGTNNTQVGSTINNNVSWVLTSSNNDGVSCSGDIETLLDYNTVQQGEHPTMGTGAFGRLFRNCTALISAPDLTPETVQTSCFISTFMGTSIVKSPKIYAKNFMGTGQFQYTFYNCSKLEELAKLNVLSLTSSCYDNMYYGCSKIKLSSTQTGEYVNEYRIPPNGQGENNSNGTSNMFANTGGTFTGAPAVNTTYYTSNEVV